MTGDLLEKYIWLVQTFVRAGAAGLTLAELGSRWERKFGCAYPRRSFNNHREAISNIFGIWIECNRSTNSYYIPDVDGLSDSDSTGKWLINTFTVNRLLTLGRERLVGRVAVEDIPSGHIHLTAVMEAMQDNEVLRIAHRKYTSGEAAEYTVHPYAVKEFSKRWYLVGWCRERKGMRVYGLDRVLRLEPTGEHFKMPADFDVEELFATSFGPYIPQERGCEVTFKATATEAAYLRDLPLHFSQKEISRNAEESIFSIFVCPDRSLALTLLGRGSSIEVLSPASLRDTVAEMARRTVEKYSGMTGSGPDSKSDSRD